MSREQIEEEVRRALANQGKEDPFKNIKPKFQYHEFPHIVLPTGMELEKAIQWLTYLLELGNKVVRVNEPIDAFVLDGAVAFAKALDRMFGVSTPESIPGFFGPEPPQMVSVETGIDTRQVVYWGAFSLPGISGKVQTTQAEKDGRRIFCVGGQVAQKSLEIVHKLAELTREIVANESIYRGNAITMAVDEEGELDFNNPPRFIDLRSTRSSNLIFNRELETQIAVNLFTPIERSEMTAKHGSLKRGILLEGEYGTGKTMLANVTALKCTIHGWTFINVPRASAFQGALKFAMLYQPAVIFVEDIDEELKGERSVSINDILNQVDGVTSKGTKLITVLTSNHAEKINKAMMRPGRLDAVLSIGRPDAESVKRLIRLYGKDLIDIEDELVETSIELEGQIPAVIREAIDRAKLYAIHRMDIEDESDPVLIDTDIAAAARTMKHHLEMMAPKPEEPTLATKLGNTMIEVVEASVSGKTEKKLKDISETVEHILQHVS